MNRFFSFSFKYFLLLLTVILLVIYLFSFLNGYIVYRYENNLAEPELQGKETKLNIIHSDGKCYYFYLPYFFLDKEAALNNLPGVGNVRDFYPPPLNKCNIGAAIMMAPFFFIGHLLTLIFNYPTYGYSIFYQHAVGIAGISYFILGLFFLKKTLLRFFSKKITFITILAIFFGSNLFHYATFDSSFSHIYSFFLFCLLLFIIPRWYETKSYRDAILLGLVLGLITTVRLFNIISILFVIFYGLNSLKDIKTRLFFIKNNYKKISLVLLSASLVFFLQTIVWKISTGKWFVYSYSGETANWLSPNIGGILFSMQKGLFFWFPILIFAFIGFFYIKREKAKVFFLPLLIYFPLLIYATSIWWEWWFGSGFGHRVFAESFCFAAILLASYYSSLKTLRSKIAAGILSLIFVSHTAMQMVFYWKGMIAFQGPNMQTYQNIFSLPEDLVNKSSLFMEKILYDFRLTDYRLFIPIVLLLLICILIYFFYKKKTALIIIIALLLVNILVTFIVFNYFPIGNKQANMAKNDSVKQESLYRSLYIDFPGMSNYKFWKSKEIDYLSELSIDRSELFIGNTFYKNTIGIMGPNNINRKDLIINNNILSIMNVKYIIDTTDPPKKIKELISKSNKTYLKKEKLILDLNDKCAFPEINDGIDVTNNDIFIKGKKGVLKILSTPVSIEENKEYAISFEITAKNKIDNYIHFDFFANNYDNPDQEFALHPEDITDEFRKIVRVIDTGQLPKNQEIFFRIFTNNSVDIFIKNLEINEVTYQQSGDKYELISDNRRIIENKKVVPRFYFPSKSILVDNISEIKEILWEFDSYFYEDRFEPEKAVIIYDDDLQDMISDKKGIVSNVKYKKDEVVINAETDENTLLVFSEINYPGWKAYVNGEETEIYGINGIIMGIVIPSGNNNVMFKYFPNKLISYIIIGISILIIGFLSFYLCRKRKKIS